MNEEYWHAREVTRIYEDLSDAQRKIETLQARIPTPGARNQRFAYPFQRVPLPAADCAGECLGLSGENQKEKREEKKEINHRRKMKYFLPIPLILVMH